MREYANSNIDVLRFLTSKDFDIRGVAKRRQGMTADVYFSKVDDFIRNAPQYAQYLLRASDSDELSQIKEHLEELGNDQLSKGIDKLCQLIEQGDKEVPKRYGVDILENFNVLYTRTKNTLARKKLIRTSTEQEEEDYSGVLLLEALEYFDNMEANRKLRILAVDDVALVLRTLTSVLSKHYEVYSLTKASQVEKFLTQVTPELFLLDIEMPELNGYDLIKVIRSFREHSETPIIFLTGNASMENFTNAMSMGACDFITKPIIPDVLLKKIESRIVWKKSF